MSIRWSRVVLYILVMSIFIAFASAPPGVTAQGPATQAATQSAQSDACADFVKAALEATNQACADTGVNQACYGNISLKAEAQPGVDNFVFDSPGKIVDLATIKSLQLSALDAEDKTWGVVLMRLRANLPGTVTGQAATMLVFGDVQLQSAVPIPTTTLPMTVTAATAFRSKPVNGSLAGSLPANATVTATGRLKDNSWVRIQVPAKDAKIMLMGWVAAKFLSGSGDINTLDVVDPTAPVYGPMQAFYFQTGVGVQSCKAAPPNGILIQTPRGSPKVNMVINDAKVTIGSTVFMDSSDDMTLSTFDGAVTVESFGKRQTIPAGMQATLPLGSDHRVSGPPEKPVAFKPQDFSTLPFSNLPAPVAPPTTAGGQTAPQRTPRPGGGSTAGVVCPSGIPIRISYPSITLPDGTTYPGRTVNAPCTCNTGTTTQSQSGPYNGQTVTITMVICN
jgi:hypothetical protein